MLVVNKDQDDEVALEACEFWYIVDLKIYYISSTTIEELCMAESDVLCCPFDLNPNLALFI